MSHIWFFFFQSIYLSKYVDPSSLDNSVRQILSKIITNTLAQNFSFQGRGNKQKFEALKIWDLIQGIYFYIHLFFVFLELKGNTFIILLFLLCSVSLNIRF